MQFRYPDLRILLFTKEPVPGQVKTRLQETLGVAGAYDLHCALLRYQVEAFQASRLAPLEVWVSGDIANPELAGLPLQAGLYQQVGSDLGQRMRSAVDAARTRSRAVVLVGTDCPSVDRDYLESALKLLASGKSLVVGPADDGGYVLLGVRESWPALFEEIPWGTDRVLSLTLERAQQLGLDHQLLPGRWDVDRPEDLARLADLDPPLNFEIRTSDRRQ